MNALFKKLTNFLHKECRQEEHALRETLHSTQRDMARFYEERQQLREQLDSANRALAGLEQDILERDEQITALTLINHNQEGQLQQAREELFSSSQEIKSLQEQLEEERKSGAEARKSISVLHAQIQNDEAHLEQALQEAKALRASLYDKEQTELRLRAAIASTEQEEKAVVQEASGLPEELSSQDSAISAEALVEVQEEPLSFIGNGAPEEEYLDASEETEAVETQVSPEATHDETEEGEILEDVVEQTLGEATDIDQDAPRDERASMVQALMSPPEDVKSETVNVAGFDQYAVDPNRAEASFDPSKLRRQLPDNVSVAATEAEWAEAEWAEKIRIKEVVEVETGNLIPVKDILSKDLAELLLLRKRQQEAVMGLRDPLYRCPECGEILNLAGSPKARGKVTHFQHTRRTSEEIRLKMRECSLRSYDDASRLSRAEIDADKYPNSQGEFHRAVKDKLAKFLQQTPEVKDLYVEKNVTSEMEGLEWKRPDIQFEYRDRKVVCELQISSTYLSVITERELFYRLKQHSVLWVFCFEEDRAQAEFESLFVRDIYFANKRNAFIFTREAYLASEASNKLHLTCVWFEPQIEQGVYNPEHVVRRSKLVTLEDLSFDEDTHKPYYVDAEALFAPYNRPFYNAYTCSYQLSLADIERAASVFLARKQARYELRLARLQQAKAEQDEARELLANSDMQITLFENKGKWGYKVGDHVVEPATYSSAELYEEEELILLYKGRRYQFIDYKGVEVGPVFHQLFPILKSKCFIRIGKEYHLLDLSTGESKLVEYKSIDPVKGIDSAFIFRVSCGRYKEKIVTADGEVAFDELKLFKNGIARAKKGGYWGYVNLQWETVIPFKYDELEPFVDVITPAKKDGRWGYINLQGETIIPFEYDELKTPEDGIIRAKKGDRWGCINLQGEIIVPFEYSELKAFEDGVAQAKKGDHWGKIDAQGNPIIEDVEEISAGVFKAKQFGKVGLQDSEGRVIYPFILDELKAFEDGVAQAKKEGYWGCLNLQGEIIIPFEYSELTTPEGGIIRAEKGGRWGCINLQGETIIPFEYDELKPFKYGVAQAKKGYHRGKIDAQGNPISEILEEVSTGVFKAKQFGKVGLQDSEGRVIYPFILDKLDPFVNGVAYAKIGNHWGKIDSHGNPVSEILEEVAPGIFRARQLGKVGLQDSEGRVIYPFILDELKSFESGVAQARKGYHWGKIDIQGNPISEDVEEVSAGVFKAKQLGMVGLQDSEGRVIYPFILDELKAFDDGVAQAKKEGCWVGCSIICF